MAEPAERSEAAPARSSRIASLLVASGILLSRIVGLVRERAIATFFGAGLYAEGFVAGVCICLLFTSDAARQEARCRLVGRRHD
nr:MAG: hypothetical protein DIU56_00005 [Pseudomonadota bacterium]